MGDYLLYLSIENVSYGFQGEKVYLLFCQTMQKKDK